jgi:hypothetical protein
MSFMHPVSFLGGTSKDLIPTGNALPASAAHSSGRISSIVGGPRTVVTPLEVRVTANMVNQKHTHLAKLKPSPLRRSRVLV